MVCASRMASSGLGSVHIDIPSAVKVDRNRESCDAHCCALSREGRWGSPPSDLIARKIDSGVQGASSFGWPPGLTACTASRIGE